MRRTITLTVNGAKYSREVENSQLLVEFLRDGLSLTGTHVGCDTSQCGTCTVTLDGKAIKSCTVLAVQVDGSSVTTIEGLAKDGELHPLQAAFSKEHALQCGFCTPGMILARPICSRGNRTRRSRTSVTRSRETSAAAPGTRTS